MGLILTTYKSWDDPPSTATRLSDVQEETLLRLQRLLRHGDLRGAQRALARAKLLNVDIKYEELEVPWC